MVRMALPSLLGLAPVGMVPVASASLLVTVRLSHCNAMDLSGAAPIIGAASSICADARVELGFFRRWK
jgi:hypothetical protein